MFAFWLILFDFNVFFLWIQSEYNSLKNVNWWQQMCFQCLEDIESISRIIFGEILCCFLNIIYASNNTEHLTFLLCQLFIN